MLRQNILWEPVLFLYCDKSERICPPLPRTSEIIKELQLISPQKSKCDNIVNRLKLRKMKIACQSLFLMLIARPKSCAIYDGFYDHITRIAPFNPIVTMSHPHDTNVAPLLHPFCTYASYHNLIPLNCIQLTYTNAHLTKRFNYEHR